MSLALRLTGVLALLVVLSGFACQKKPQGAPLTTIPDQQESVAGMPEVVALQQCENWAWAAAAESILRLQQVRLPQNYWVMKASGGEVCIDRTPTLESIAAVLEGDYVLEDGRKVHLRTRIYHGAPTAVDDIILAVRQQHPWLLYWRGHAYLLSGLVFDEYQAGTGDRMFIAKRLLLQDPYFSSEKRHVIFDREQHEVSELEGMMEIVAENR